MRPDVHHRIRLKDSLEVCIQSHETMMRRTAFGREQSHRIAFIAKRRLDSDKHISKTMTQHQDLASVRVDRPRSLPPLRLDITDVRAQEPIFIRAHTIRNVSERSRVI